MDGHRAQYRRHVPPDSRDVGHGGRHHARRLAYTFPLLFVQATLLFGAEQLAHAATASCRVTNSATNAITVGDGTNLQQAIRDAAPHSVLKIQGRCVGTFHVRKAITLWGRPSRGFRTPTLAGNHAGTVLIVRRMGNIIVRNLRITDGRGTDHRFGAVGGGILNRRGRVVLEGNTRVAGNGSDNGAGIWNSGTLIIRGRTIVARNRAHGDLGNGGGIYQRAGRLVIQGSSWVRRNRSAGNGGGIVQYLGSVIIRGRASIRGNSSGDYGGGIYFERQRLTLSDLARVTGNTARLAGGGIYSGGNVIRVCSPGVRISPNVPDDPPPTATC